ncbi:sorbin and SH3 domain-containing protein 1 homolog isoform X9 [Drosophila tropicalis]|uniref:sorbin and SH3 domain-containing protein 1 homolog isoform X9 n=1 Tax=Drosophila tropicalis TaxID=46794 RepID=UPI0035AB75BB
MGQETTPTTTTSTTMFAPKFKARAPTGSGVWTPKSQTPCGSTNDLNFGSSSVGAPTPPPPPTQPIWTPQPSPALSGRKEFRPVRFESPTLPRRYTALQGQPAAPPSGSYITNGDYPLPPPAPRSVNSNSDYAETDCSTQHQQQQQQQFGFGPVAPSASVSDKIKTFERSASTSELQRPFIRRQLSDTSRPVYRPNEVTRPSYKSNGYVSEPEPNYDSDYSTVRYRTQNPHRVQSVSSAVNVRNLNQDEKLYGTMPNPIKSAQNSYKNQPGRIENYTTGHSSVSEKEKKEWWDEVMDIFNGNLEQSKLSPLYTEGNLSRALAKESGYTSDSNLVFRKKELSFGSPLSPVEQKQAYKSLQAGGEPPLLGFRKPAPEKPKDYDSSAPPIPPQPPIKGLVSPLYDEPDVNIHFKTPVRHEYKQNISEEELAIRQAEHMQKLYQEERRRKYLQELQDMNSRRHTDNFTPSQKSPIALNRYDDFPTDVTLKSLVGPKTVAKALYNFQGQTSKELSFRKGDTIYIRRQIDANWFEGEHNAMIGLLPASYVEIVSRDGARTPAKRPSEGQARAKYNFQAQSGIELSLNKGELVTLTRRVDGNWFEGKIANRKGIFPVSYVEILTDIGAEDIAARTTTTVINSQSTTNLRPNLDVLRTNINNEFNTLTQNGAQPPNGILKDTRGLHKTDALHVDTTSEPVAYRALYKYRPQNSDELELLEGDLVHVLEKCDDGWFVGTSQRTGCFGTFPGNYVERA